MTFFDWLMSPAGQDLQHAVIALLVAGAAYLSYLAHNQAKSNAAQLGDHLEEHALGDQVDSDPRTGAS